MTKAYIHCVGKNSCGSTNYIKHGSAVRNRKKIQQYLCKDCYNIFREPKEGWGNPPKEDGK